MIAKPRYMRDIEAGKATDPVVTGKRGAIEGRARLGERSYACRLDRSGILADKREGDGATPVGRFPLRAIRLPK